MSLAGTVWAPRGPSPITSGTREDNGLTTAIAVNPNDGSVIYQGTAGGGVWRSLDGGATWTPIFDRQVSLGIGEPGALAIDPNDTSTIYIGTSQRVTPQLQAGLFKSTDGGASCIRLGSGYPAGNVGNATQFTADWINVIIVDPANSQVVYLAALSGVYRSVDGGLNWTLGNNSGGDAQTLVLDTSSPAGARILYAGINGRGVFQSTDGGQNWNQVLGAATPAVAAAIGPPPAGFGEVVVALAPPTAPPNPAGIQVLYVVLVGTGGAADPIGIFRSIDQGANWNQQTGTGLPTGTYGGYCFHLGVDPASPGNGTNDIIYAGAIGQARSTDSGTTFNNLTGMHADTHTWAFVPQPAPTPTTVYCGTDGGLFRSTDNGATWTPLNKGSLQTSLFYNITVRPDATASVTVGALQDNQVESTSGAPGLTWVGTNGGDGWDVAYDGVTAGRVYATSGFWSPAPCTRVWRSDDDGVTWAEFTPWGTTSDAGCYLAPVSTDPSAAGIVYVGGSQNLWQSRDGAATWRNLAALPGSAEVAPTNGNNVVVTVGNQVWVSTSALAATVGAPNGVTFANITPGLPNRPVLRAAFDPNDPTVIYAVLGGFDGPGAQAGHVFRRTIAGPGWTNISPALNVPFSALALDGADTPTTIYVGTHLGVLRSVDEGNTWTVLDDIHFPRAPVTDLVLNPQARMLRAATYGRGVFEFVQPTWPSIAVNPQNGLAFGTVCGGPNFLTLQIFNVGKGDLVITSVQRLMGSARFSVLPFPGTPLVIKEGEEVDFTVQYNPTGPGAQDTATIRIVSNDPGSPILDLMANGRRGDGSLAVAIPDNGQFGDVCLGSFVDRGLVLNNRGPCPLRILNITSSSAAFEVPGVNLYPIAIAAGASVELCIRFRPSALGPAAAVLTVQSDDPVSPKLVQVTGHAPAPRLVVVIADAGNFGDTCVGSFTDRPLTLSNSGRCALTVTNITSTSPEFIPPGVNAYPIVIAAGASIQVPIRFQPTSHGPKSAVLTMTSDDPTGPKTIVVTGNAPAGKLAVSGTTQFGGVELGERARLVVTICNVGPCDLHVTKVAFKPLCGCDGEYDETGCPEHGHGDCGCKGAQDPDCDQRCSDFRLLNNPFPATLRPGSCMPLMIRFEPRCETSRCCELVIESDDPTQPQKTLYVTGHLKRTLSSALKCWLGEELRKMMHAGKK